MSSASLVGRHPADELQHRLSEKYFARLLKSIKSCASRLAKVIFPCRHGNLSAPSNKTQTCLDCGATRSYLSDDVFCPGDTAIWTGPWEKACAPARPARASHLTPANADATASGPCCVGVDVPGVGVTHAARCPYRPSTQPAREPVPGEVPPSLGRYLRDDLLCQLLFAARNLAEANIINGHSRHGSLHLGLICRECHFGATADGLLHHATSCNTGRVLALIADLLAFSGAQSNSKLEDSDTQKTITAANVVEIGAALMAAERIIDEELENRKRSGLDEADPYIGQPGRVLVAIARALELLGLGGAR